MRSSITSRNHYNLPQVTFFFFNLKNKNKKNVKLIIKHNVARNFIQSKKLTNKVIINTRVHYTKNAREPNI